MNEKYDVIIIGAGIGGLVAGCYLAKAGLKTLIIEQHNIPGGYCSSFNRQGYRFDVGIHYLGGIKKGILGKIIHELELKQYLTINQFDPTDKFIFPDHTFYIRANPYDTIAEFKKIFRSERINIDNFFKFLINKDFISIYSKLKKLTFKNMLDDSFKDERIKAALSGLLSNIGSPPDKVSAVTVASFFREFILDPGYYPQGGMQALPNALVSKFREFGGNLFLKKQVVKILTKNNKIKGVILDDRSKLESKFIVSNADATLTFKVLLDDKKTKESIAVDKLKTSSSVVALYLGINSNERIIRESCNIWFFDSYNIIKYFSSLEKIIKQRDVPFGMICFPSKHDSTVSPDKNTIQFFINAPFISEKFWQDNKKKMVDKMLNKIEHYVPILTNMEIVEQKIGATPLTFKRYTSNKNGAIYGWESNPRQLRHWKITQNTSITGLFLAGHWCSSGIGEGGIPGVASLGRNAARLIFNALDKEWGYPLFIL